MTKARSQEQQIELTEESSGPPESLPAASLSLLLVPKPGKNGDQA